MSSIFGGGSNTTVIQQPIAAPTPLPPPTMPDPTNPSTIAAGAMQQRQAALRAGRQSSILTTDATRPQTIAGGTLGGGKQQGGGASPGAGAPAPVYSNTSL
jgi:hypothetical protein